MKRKLTLSILGVAGVTLSLVASPRSASEALRVAQSFYSGKSLLRSVSEKDFQLVYTGEESGLRASSSEPYYYIYNVGEDGGFVMVSGDDRVAPVAGYALSGSFRPEEMPSNLRGWFEGYKRQIDYARTLPERPYAEEVSALRSATGLPERVEPLIRTKWNQDAPYNDLCPMEGDKRALTGCGATAMAQIMNYHRWPEKAAGQGAYTVPAVGGDATIVDLEGITFDWANMSDTYDSTSTAVQKKAVAVLMAAAGASVNMMYGAAAGSGAYNKDILGGFVRNMGYDKNASYLSRNFFSSDKWYALLKSELAAGRPIFYMAQSIQGGHFFVCDGYDENEFFHMNWGWGGYQDNYFKLDLLWENDASSNLSGYSWSQEMVVGIQRPTGQSEGYEEVRMYPIVPDDEVISCGDTLSFTYSYQYGGILHFRKLEQSIDLYQGDKLIRNLDLVQDDSFLILGIPYGYDCRIPDFRLDPGTYDLRVRYRFEGDSEWKEVESTYDGACDGFRLVVEGTTIKWDCSSRILSGTPIVMERMEDVRGYTWKAETVVRNGSESQEVQSFLGAHIFSSQLDTMFYAAGLALAPGEERELEIPLTIQLVPGEYQIELINTSFLGFFERDSYLYILEGTTSTFVVSDAATSVGSPEEGRFAIRVSGDRLLIDSDRPLGEVRIYDCSGRLARMGVGPEISISGLSSGVYFVHLETGGQTRVRKISIQ